MNIVSTTKRDQTSRPKQQAAGTSEQISSSTSTSSWSRLKDPRIVRVSRAFGGKDRHSKVCTVRGLRDRRVRLSVPTAIQLYDLQDRLGLNQPSKVVDWLLNAAKHEIDDLPPLQIPPAGILTNSLLLDHGPHDDRLQQGVLTKMNALNWEHPSSSKEVTIARETKQEGIQQTNNRPFLSSTHFLSRPNHSSSSSSSLPPAAGFLNNLVPNNSFLGWDPSNLSLSQFGNPHQTNQDVQSSAGSHHQFLLYPPQTQSYFPSHVTNASGEINFQMLTSTTTTTTQNPLPITSTTPSSLITQAMMRPFHLSMNPKFFPCQNSNQNDPNKHT